MPNLFFFSLQEDLNIEYAKVTIKFDNLGEGRARFSFKLWLKKENLKENPELYFLVSNRENPVILEEIYKGYHQHLREENFKKAAGIEDTTKRKEHERYIIEKITKFKEDEDLVGEDLLNPEHVDIEITFPTGLPKEVSKHIQRHRDILLKIQPHIDSEKIKEMEKVKLIGFQFRIFFNEFLTQETLKSWKSSSEPWSVDIDIHKGRNYDDILHYFGDILKYPKKLDVWVVIPHDHLFIASSPAHKSAIKLKKEDTQYKTYKRIEDPEKKAFYEKFNTNIGDYSVRISSTEEEQEEFSVICVSPFLHGESPNELKKNILEFRKSSKEIKEEFEKESEKFVKWEDIISSLVIILAILSIIFSIPAYKGGFGDEIIDLLLKSIVFGIVLWAVWLTCDRIAKVFRKKADIGKIMVLVIIIALSFILLQLHV